MSLLADVLTLALAVVGGGGIVGVVQQLRRGKADKRATDVDTIDKAIDTSLGLFERLTALEDQLTATRRRVTSLEDWRHRMRVHTRSLVQWVDAGALPPPPAVADELRQMLED